MLRRYGEIRIVSHRTRIEPECARGARLRLGAVGDLRPHDCLEYLAIGMHDLALTRRGAAKEERGSEARQGSGATRLNNFHPHP